MKIAFDENVPIGMVRVFQTLAKERQLRRQMGNFEIVSARDYTPKPTEGDYIKKSDLPWLARFARDNGKVVISGDRGMLDAPHELLALQQHGFIAIFFERRWSDWDFFRKSSLLLHYWRVIAKRVRTAKPGTLLRIPGHWREDGDLQDVTLQTQKIYKAPPRKPDRTLSPTREDAELQRGRSDVRDKAKSDRAIQARIEKDPRQGELNLVPSVTATQAVTDPSADS